MDAVGRAMLPWSSCDARAEWCSAGALSVPLRMTLDPGSTLSSYQILSPLGSGAMGEVYRARDTRLDREVAIKVLPEQLAADENRLQRFEREARTLAALNHPAIGQIYGFERDDIRTFLVLELVPGEDLSDQIGRGPIELHRSVELALQIAEGLEAAHDVGVVHRDLKPGNVRVTPGGAAKVLDFGLAKSVTAQPADDSEKLLTTREGTLLGTPPYMSPEQARGAPVCHRSDVWAFGCLLYEMLTGKQAFTGDTIADLITAILEKEPDWKAVPDARLRRLLQRCLAKDPRRRLQHVGEARILLEDFLAGVPEEVDPARSRGLGRAALAVGALLVFAAGWLAFGATRTADIPRETRLTVPLPLDRVLLGMDRTAPPFALSPDGRTLVYVARASHGGSQLFVQRFDSFTATPLAGTERGRAPFFSPDGEWVGYFADRGLLKVPVSGGTSLEICDVSISDRGSGCWGEDGTILFTVGLNTGGWLSRVPDTGGEPEIVVVPDPSRGEAWFGSPQFLPGGKRALVTISSVAGLRTAVLDLATGSLTEVAGTGDASGACYTGDGVLVFCQTGNLMAARFDPGVPKVLGPPRVVVESVYGPGIGPLYYAIAPAGTLVFVPGETANAALLVVDRSGGELWRSPERGVFQHPRFSPDGTRMAYDAQRLDGRDVWVYEPRGTRTRLTQAGVNLDPLWSQDGRMVTFRRNAGSGTVVYEVASNGRGEPNRVANLVSEGLQIPGSWTPSGDLLFTLVEGTVLDIWTASPHGETAALIDGAHNEAWPALSRSGKWLAYVSDETGRNEVYLCSYPDIGLRQAVTSDGGVEPVWADDDDELYFRSGPGFYSVSLSHENGLSIGTPQLLFTGDYDMAPNGHQHYDVSPDGERLLVVEAGQDVSFGQLRVILNWKPDLDEGP